MTSIQNIHSGQIAYLYGVINSGAIPVYPPANDIVTITGTQTITGDKTFTGTVNAPTVNVLDDSTSVATTEWVKDYVPTITGGFVTASANNVFTGINSFVNPVTPTTTTFDEIDMIGNDILQVNNIDLVTINGSAYPPVVGADTLSAVLTAGNNAGSSSIDMNAQNISNGGTFTATSFVGALTGNASSATTATNIAGGLGGSIPYQSAVNTTALLANGTAGQVLQSNGTTLAPSWTTPSTSASTISVTQTQSPTAGTYYPTFVSGSGAGQTLRADITGGVGGLSYTPSSNLLSLTDGSDVTNIYPFQVDTVNVQAQFLNASSSCQISFIADFVSGGIAFKKIATFDPATGVKENSLVNTTTTGTTTLTASNAFTTTINTPSASGRIFVLPAPNVGSVGYWYAVCNKSTAFTIEVQYPLGTTIAVIPVAPSSTNGGSVARFAVTTGGASYFVVSDVTNASNATNVGITSDNTAGTYYLPFAKTSGTGNKPLFIDDTTGPLTYNPSTGTVSATTYKISGTPSLAVDASTFGQVGLVKIATVQVAITGSAAAQNLSFASLFNSTYKNYRITLRPTTQVAFSAYPSYALQAFLGTGTLPTVASLFGNETNTTNAGAVVLPVYTTGATISSAPLIFAVSSFTNKEVQFEILNVGYTATQTQIVQLSCKSVYGNPGVTGVSDRTITCSSLTGATITGLSIQQSSIGVSNNFTLEAVIYGYNQL